MPDEFSISEGSSGINGKDNSGKDENNGNNDNNGKDEEDKAGSVAGILKIITGNEDEERGRKTAVPKTGTDMEGLIADTNSKILLEVLSPEIEENEDKKRRHKDLLLGMMGAFLVFQFLVTAILVIDSGFFIMLCHLIGKPFSDETIKIIFKFIGVYITSVVIELIAILNYIVQKVFDTSVADLFAIFKDGQTKK